MQSFPEKAYLELITSEKIAWHTLSVDRVLKLLESSRNGLAENDILKRQTIFGLNELPKPPQKHPLKIFLEQFNNVLILILLGIVVLYSLLALGETNIERQFDYMADILVILVIVGFNAFIGLYQELKARKAVHSLRSLLESQAIVYRNSLKRSIPLNQLVPGDIVEIEAGQKVPADSRLIQSNNLQINESALTGESIPVNKSADVLLPEKIATGDKINMIFMGSLVTFGKGIAVVTTTGMKTEVGKIATLISKIESLETPLQHRLKIFSQQLGTLVIVISIFIVSSGFFFEFTFRQDESNLFLTIIDLISIGVSLAVAAIPEGLPAVLTLTLALGVRKMAKKNAICQNLQAVEALGSTTFICTDKTGTLTLNELTVTTFMTIENTFSINLKDLPLISASQDKAYSYLLDICELVNTAVYDFDGVTGKFKEIGDPLEVALLKTIKLYEEKNIRKMLLWQKYSELPFDSTRKLMSSIFALTDQEFLLLTKGAPDVLINRCTKFMKKNGSLENLDAKSKEIFYLKLDELTTQGLRIIGCAMKTISKETASLTLNSHFNMSDIESGLVFLGYIGLIDPPRPEVRQAIGNCRAAGIEVAMITGDHPNTALAIAEQVGITFQRSRKVIKGIDLENLSDTELATDLDDVRVFARVDPESKLRIVNILKQKKHVVAMTGDGVNDAPALKQADIGVAMGKGGTDAARESSRIVLADDNFATLAYAVEEGRIINDNIKKFIGYLLASNSGEVLLIALAVIIVGFFSPTFISEFSPLSPSQILYMNLITDSFLAIALGLEQKEPNIMSRPPKDPRVSLIKRSDAFSYLMTGIVLSSLTLILFLLLLGNPSGWSNISPERLQYAQTMAMSLIIFMESFVALSYRSSYSIHTIGFFSNHYFTLAFLAVYVAHIMILYIPAFNELFHLTPLAITDWLLLLTLAVVVFFIEETRKYLLRKNNYKLNSPLSESYNRIYN